MAVQRAPFPRDPEEFGADSRISFSKETDNYVLEDETGEEWEWLSNLSKWVPAVSTLNNDGLWPAYSMV